jgi:hypothetical protein
MKSDLVGEIRDCKVCAETPEFQRRLGAYAISAAAAGVAILACSVNAEAAPICRSSSVELFQQSAPLNPAGLRIAPFELADTFNNVSSIPGDAGNRGFFTPNTPSASALLATNHFPANVAAGTSIGPGRSFGKGREYGLLFTYGPLYGGGTKKKHRGNFDFSQDNFFGFKFSISGQPHYGWVRLKVTFGYALDGIGTKVHLLDYGYESDPNTPILAGSCSQNDSVGQKLDLRNKEVSDQAAVIKATTRAAFPASLGLLATGASGLSIWRR